ncbi:MAG TPA: mechanosensitive ion channel family protein [Salinimicrobium sp.]|nr:mechanosensitive ion channel family protein [Salinimicrobium sp.]
MENLESVQHYITEYVEKFIAYLPNLLGALLLLILGWWFIKLIIRYVRKIFEQKNVDPALQNFILSITNWALKIMLFITVIGQLGIATTSFIAAIGAAGLAIGLALQGSLANFAGGVLIILLKPFKIGDWIEVNDVSGSVKEISLFYTKLNTFGNQLAIIPNGELSNDNIINYTSEGIRKEEIKIRISYNSDIKLSREILLKLVSEQKQIFRDPAPEVLVSSLEESAVTLSVRYWTTNEDFWSTHFYFLEESKIRLEEKGVEIPYPQRNIHIFPEPKTDSSI